MHQRSSFFLSSPPLSLSFAAPVEARDTIHANHARREAKVADSKSICMDSDREKQEINHRCAGWGIQMKRHAIQLPSLLKTKVRETETAFSPTLNALNNDPPRIPHCSSSIHGTINWRMRLTTNNGALILLSTKSEPREPITMTSIQVLSRPRLLPLWPYSKSNR